MAEGLGREELRYIRKHHRDASVKQIAKALEIDVRRVKDAIRAIAREEVAEGGFAGDSRVSWAIGTGLACALVALATWLAYRGTENHGFHFDDGLGIEQNYLIRDPKDVSNLLHANPTRSILYLTFAFNYWYAKDAYGNGLALPGYHYVNWFIHGLNGSLVFVLAALTLRASGMRASFAPANAFAIALFASLVFAVHPLQTGAVTYLVQRTESLCATWYLLALILYAVARRLDPEVRIAAAAIPCYAGAMIATILAGLTKEVAVTIPIALVLYEAAFHRREGVPARRLALLASPFVALIAFVPYLVFFRLGIATVSAAVTRAQEEGALMDFGRTEYLMTQWRVVFRYLLMFVVPVNQNVDHDVTVARSLLEPSTFISLAALVALTSLSLAALLHPRVAGRPVPRLLGFSFLFLLSVLSPTSTFWVLPDLMFEHRVYLPLAFLSLSLVTVAHCAILPAGPRLRSPARPLAFAALCLAVVVVLGALARKRNEVWANDVTLWSDAALKSPGKARPHSNLGLAYQVLQSPAPAQRERELELACAQFEAALECDPEFTKARNNLGMIYVERGLHAREAGDHARARAHWTRAIACFEEVLRQREDEDFVAHNNLGNLYNALMGDQDHAIPHLERVRALTTTQPIVSAILGEIWMSRGDYVRAEEDFRRFFAGARLDDPKYAYVQGVFGAFLVSCTSRKEEGLTLLHAALNALEGQQLARDEQMRVQSWRTQIEQTERELGIRQEPARAAIPPPAQGFIRQRGGGAP